MEYNSFLRNFVNMRKQLASASPAPVSGGYSLINPNLSRQAPSLLPSQSTKPVMKGDVTFKKIVEDKPGKAKVMEYLRNRIEELRPEYEA
jgi:hypothetical protein